MTGEDECRCHILPHGDRCYGCAWRAAAPECECRACGLELRWVNGAWRIVTGAQMCGVTGYGHSLELGRERRARLIEEARWEAATDQPAAFMP